MEANKCAAFLHMMATLVAVGASVLWFFVPLPLLDSVTILGSTFAIMGAASTAVASALSIGEVKCAAPKTDARAPITIFVAIALSFLVPAASLAGAALLFSGARAQTPLLFIFSCQAILWILFERYINLVARLESLVSATPKP